ncbi:DUF397 domain-containing protein [Actinomadura sp. 1N219]
MSPVWRKSSRSDTEGDECVKVADLSGGVGLRSPNCSTP